MPSRRRTAKQPFGWISALLFNAVLIAFFWAASLLIAENRNALGEEFVTSSEAVAATRNAMNDLFADIVPRDAIQRNFWADQIENELVEDDLESARGFLMAAPAMLGEKDAAAVRAAANTERVGKLDDRLVSAALLFLPDNVRARYERITAPSQPISADIDTSDEETEGPTINPGDPEPETIAYDADQVISAENNTNFFVLGNERDLSFQGAGWVRGDRIDTFELRLSGLGLAIHRDQLTAPRISDETIGGASLVKSANRAGRLDQKFTDLLKQRLEQAMPEARLREELQASLTAGNGILINGDEVLNAFVRATDTEKLGPLVSDLNRIAQLAEDRPHSAAMTILETITSLRDLKRAELIAFAGGDRAVTLTKYYGNDALDAATTVLDWTTRLIMLVVITTALALILVWLAISVFLRSFNRNSSIYARSYGY